MTSRRDRVIVAIALFRLTKAAALIAIGSGVLHLVHPAAASALRDWFESLPFVAEHAAAEQAVSFFTRLPPTRMRELAVGAFAYATLFIIEGVGLLRGKTWAEWLTIIATTSFIPFEIVEVARRTTALRVSVVIINAAIVVYLVRRRLTVDKRLGRIAP